jgi:hypothetical protein
MHNSTRENTANIYNHNTLIIHLCTLFYSSKYTKSALLTIVLTLESLVVCAVHHNRQELIFLGDETSNVDDRNCRNEKHFVRIRRSGIVFIPQISWFGTST